MGVLLFALPRSGGSYVSQILSGGGCILSEPELTNDGFTRTETENVRRILEFQEEAKQFQVVKVCDFKNYLERLADRRLGLPEGLTAICLFRHPYAQIASHLFTFCDWADNWAPRENFWTAIRLYKEHVEQCLMLSERYGARFLKYEDTIGDKALDVLHDIYEAEAANFLDYALRVQHLRFRLGPVSDGATWEPSTYSLVPKEKYWVVDHLKAEMELLGYGR